MSRRSKWRVPAASASNTGLMPQMRFMACGSGPFLEEHRRESGDALAPPQGAEVVGALGLHRDPPRLHPERPGDGGAHRLEVGREDRLLGDRP